MNYLDYTFISYTFQYFYSNISSTLYIVEVLPGQAAYLSSFFSLVRDISESYGSWVVIIFLVMSALMIMVGVQQSVEKGSSIIKSKYKTRSSSLNRISLDFFFTSLNYTKCYVHSRK